MNDNITSKGKRRLNAESNIGKTFGKITVALILNTNARGKFYAQGSCACGKTWTGLLADLRYRKGLRSCGCYRSPSTLPRSRSVAAVVKHSEAKRGQRTAEYLAWAGMIARCYNPTYTSYSTYGGAGIAVCEQWRHSYETFLSDMGRKPTKQHSLDRVDGLLGYSLANCRWATKKEQVLNRKNTRWLTHKGETKCLRDWETKLSLSRGTLRRYISDEVTLDDVIERLAKVG